MTKPCADTAINGKIVPKRVEALCEGKVRGTNRNIKQRDRCFGGQNVTSEHKILERLWSLVSLGF